MLQPPDMSLLDDLEDEDVDSKPQPTGKSFYAGAVNFPRHKRTVRKKLF